MNNLKYIELEKFRTLEEFKTYTESIDNRRLLVEKIISIDNKDKEKWSMIGYCECCQRESRFLLDWNCSDGKNVNFRERLVCEHCGLNNRQRFTAKYLINLMNNKKK